MAGHSKWANTKHRKARVDAQKGKIFTKLAREMIVAARQGGADTNTNFSLRLAVQKARANNMPNDNIQRAIQRGAGGLDGDNFEQANYEGYASGGVAVLLETLTDNRNRTVAEIRHLFSKHGGNLGETGCVSYMFARKGFIMVKKDNTSLDEDEMMMLALEAGAEDVKDEYESYMITCSPEDFEAVNNYLQEQNITVDAAEVTMLPQSTVAVDDPDEAARVIKLIDALEDLDDVQNVFANFDIPDELMN